jgi:hypothetical protein
VRRTAFLFDLVVVIIFVAIGRSVHTDGRSVTGLVSTSWPFVIGLGLGSLGRRSRAETTPTVARGIPTVIITVTVGMVLRVLSGQGTALAFIGVALGFLGLGMLGWRAVLSTIVRSRAVGGLLRSGPPEP